MQKKYNFVPESQLNKDTNGSEFQVNINRNGCIYFGSDIVRIYDLENKVIRLYADIEKKSIAWIEIKNGNLSTLENVRVLKKNNPKVDCIVIMITKLLKSLGIEKTMLPFKNISVTTYKDNLIEGSFHVLDLSDYIKK